MNFIDEGLGVVIIGYKWLCFEKFDFFFLYYVVIWNYFLVFFIVDYLNIVGSSMLVDLVLCVSEEMLWVVFFGEVVKKVMERLLFLWCIGSLSNM